MKSSVYILLLLALLACTKEEGFIPNVDKDDPYYSEHNPTQEWDIQASIDDHTYSVIQGTPQIVGDLVIVMIRAKNQLKAYDYADGDLTWELDVEPYFGSQTPENYLILARAGTLYLIDRQTGIYVSLSPETGQVLNTQDPNDFGHKLRYMFPAFIVGDYFYKINYLDQGKSSIIKYHFLDNTFEILDTIEGYEQIDDFSNAQLDASESRFYFTARLDRRNKGAFSLDLESGKIDLIWQENELPFNNTQFLATEDLLIIDNNWGEIIAVSKTSGNIVWAFNNQELGPVDNMTAKKDKIYLNGNDLLLSLHLHSGELNWIKSGPELHDRVLLFEHEDILIAANNTPNSSSLDLFDLTDGQTLIELQLPDDHPIISFKYDEENRAVIIASNYHLYKYSNLLP